METIQMNKFLLSDLSNARQFHAIRADDVVRGLVGGPCDQYTPQGKDACEEAGCTWWNNRCGMGGPWPHPDSHCSPCTIYIRGQSYMLWDVWGSFYGDTSRKRFYAQTSCTDVTTTRVMRLVCVVRKLTTNPVPSNHGLVIGLVAQDTLNDPEKLHNPNLWPWYGYLADLPTANEYYLVYSDVNEGFWSPPSPLYLCFFTYAEYQTWAAGGYGKALPAGLPLWQYNLNEPGKTDGWTQQSDYWHHMVIPYMQGMFPMVEGFCEIRDPHFPPTAQVGEWYYCDFIIDQLTAFPCGCPETIVWQIFDRDTDEPIHDPVTHLLDCGWTGALFEPQIKFGESGTFHGELKAGHKINDQWQVDEPTYIFDVEVSPAPRAIGSIDFDLSAFSEGPFNPSQIATVMDLYYKNSGTKSGYINAKIYEYPGETKENLLGSRYKLLDPGIYDDHWPKSEMIPPDITKWPLGVKVWADDETKPEWGAIGTKMFKILRS